MAGQGITVSIQAKIEGWQDQIKQIQNAMKNIKPGSDMSKSLMKDLQQVENMVNNLGKNMTQRFTSDSQITHFVDKMMDVERVFDRIGSSMQNVSFGDINPDYITNNFKDLLSTLEKANDALGTGMQTSFQNAIADSKDLQKEFARMKLDPKDMNIDQVRDALKSRGDSLAKEMQAAQAEVGKLKQKMDEARAARDELQNRKQFIGDDPNARAMEILGGNLPANGTLLDQKAIDEKLQTIRSTFMNMGMTEADLNRILPSVDKLMQAAKWDQIPDKLAGYIRDAGIKNDNKLYAAQGRFDAAKTDYSKYTTGPLNKLSAEVYGNSKAQESLEAEVAAIVQRETAQLRMQVEQLKAQLEGRATEGIHSTGKNVSGASTQGMQDAAAAADQYAAALERVKAGEQMVGKIQGVIQRWFSVYAVVRMVTNAVKKAAKNIQELDSTMTEIAIVTKMDQGDLWAQMPKYTKMAREYASSIKGVYEVSQIYYQQGLQMNDVMALTESTLKMARISGLDYSEAADYMTNAIRSFKMEMTDAERVVDVYSAVAASSASNVTELATAMSKTASSAQAVGSSFENTTAMLAVMIEATRESPENIGSAMKSIISRYGELKENKTGIDEEGEEYSLNKVDKALQTVGISIHDANGEFRDFDDVIFELSEHWNEIDKNTQRYIATVMAGNRQQSRFLALVSSSERLKEESAKATNSEDAAQLQFLKSLDSIDAKKQQLETSIQSIYTNSGIEQVYKDILDFTNNVLISFDNLSSEAGLGAAIGKMGATFMTLATLVTNAFALVKARMAASGAEITAQAAVNNAQLLAEKAKGIAQEQKMDEERKNNAIKTEEQIAAEKKAIQAKSEAETLKQSAKQRAKKVGLGMVASTIGLGFTTAAASLDVNKDREKKAWMTGLGGVLSGIGTGAMIGGIPGLIMGALTAIPSILEAVGLASESVAEKVERLQKNVDDTRNEKIKAKDDLKTLSDYKNKYEELRKTQYESAEKQKEFRDLQNEIAEKYPSLIGSMDGEGNAILNMTDAYETLAEAKQKAYAETFSANLGAELGALKDIDYVLQSIYGVTPGKNKKNNWGYELDRAEKLPQYFAASYRGASGARENGVISKVGNGYNYGDAGYMQLLADDRMGNLSSFFGLKRDERVGVRYQSGWIDQDSYSFAATQAYLGKIYEAYEEGAQSDKALETVKSSIDTWQLFGETLQELEKTNPEEWQALMANESKGALALYEQLKGAEFSEENYKLWKQTIAAEQYGEKASTRLIQSRSSEFINAMNETYGEDLDFNTSQLQRYAISNKISKELQDFWLNESRQYLNNDEYQYTDSEGKPHKYDEEHLIQDYFNGGIRNKEGQIIRKSNISSTGKWYEDTLKEYSYLEETLDELYTNLGKSSKNEIRKNLTKYVPETSEHFEGIALLLEDAFTEQYDSILKRYNNWAEQGLEDTVKDTAVRDTIANFSNLFGPEYLQDIQDQYKTIIKNTSLSKGQKESQIKDLTTIFDAISSIENPDIQTSILSKIQNADLTSINGIYTLIETLTDIEDFDLDTGSGLDLKQKLKDFSKNLRINVETEINSYFDSMETASEGFDKALSSATGGMDLKAAKEMADKVGVSLKDFTIKDGKFYYDDLGKIQEAYTIDAQDRFTELKKNVTERYSTFLNSAGVAMGTVEEGVIYSSSIKNASKEVADLKAMSADYKKEFEAQTNIDYDEFVNYYEQYKKYYDEFNTEEGNPLSFVDWIAQNIDEQLADSVKAIEEWQTQTQAISELKNGKFEGFLKTTGEWKSTEEIEKRLQQYKVNQEKFGGQEELIDTAERQLAEANELNQQMIDAIAEGKADLLSPENQKKYGKLVRDTYKAVQSSLVTSIFDAMEGGTTTLEVTEANQKYLQNIYEKGWFEEGTKLEDITAGQEVKLDLNKVLENEANLWDVIYNSYDNEKDRLEAFKNYHDKKYSKNKLTALEGITDGEIAYGDFLDYLTTVGGKTTAELFAAEGNNIDKYVADYGLALTQSGDYIVENWAQYIKAVEDSAQEVLESDATTYDKNRARAAIQTAQRAQQTAIEDAASDILDNYDDVSIEMQEAMANALGYTSDQLLDLGLYQMGLDGKTKLDVGRFRSFSKGFSSEIQEVLNEQFASIADDYLDNIKDATSMVTSGTSSQSEIAQFKAKAKELGVDVKDEAFKYMEKENAWILDGDIMREFTLAQGKQLLETGLLKPEEFEAWAAKNTDKALAEAIDVQEYLDKEIRTKEDRQTLKDQLVNAGIQRKGYKRKTTKVDEDFADQLAEAEEAVNTATDEVTRKQARASLDKLRATIKAEKEKVQAEDTAAAQEAADQLINDLEAGGALGVSALIAITTAAEQEVSSADIEKAYRTKISKLEEALDQLEYGIGSIVSGEAVQILEKAGYQLQDLGGGSAVITGLVDIAEAYQSYYNTLSQNNEVTLAALNEAKAKVLETQDGRHKEQIAIDAIGDAAGMTYTTFAAILSDAGIELNDQIIDQYTESLGGGKMRIKDFAAFARTMKWDYDSEEYTSAFKSYNDSLIERNKQVKNNIEEEIKGLEDIKPGDWLNLTETEKAIKKAGKDNSKQIAKASRKLYEAQANDTQNAAARWQQELERLQSEDVLYSLNQSLIKFGAYLDDGILKIDDNANILGIAQTLISTTEQAGIEISAEMQDMISNMIKSYSEAIAKGIEGGMTNTEKEDLIKKAYNLGFEPEDLQFNETIDGLELTQQSAIQVYKALSQLDRKQSVKALSALTKKLEENNEKYKTTTSLLSHIAELEDQINSGKYSDERLEALRAELEVARQINAERLISGEADWNFMNNNALPGSFTNAIEYWQGWASAAKQLTDAGTKGQIDPAALATMFQHVYELAEATGEDLTFMGLSTADQSFTGLLDMLGSIVQIDAQTGQALLTADKLKTLGIDLSLGAQGISQGVQDAANKYAKMNGDQLKNIHEFYDDLANMKDALDEQHIDWNDYFDSGEFDYSKFKKDLSNKKGALDSFNNFADKVTVGNTKLSTLLENGEITGATAKAMQSIFTMMSAEDWDATTGYQDIATHLASSGFQGALDLGDMEFEVRGNHVLMRADKDQEWKDTEGKSLGKDAQAAFEAMNEKDLAEYAKEFEAYKSSTETSQTKIEIPGTEYTIQVDGDHFVLVHKDGTVVEGTNYSSVEEALTGSRQAVIDDLGKKMKKARSEGNIEEWDQLFNKQYALKNYLSDEGYSEWTKSIDKTGKWIGSKKAGKGAHGYITEETRSKLIAGKYTAESLESEARQLWESSGLSSEQAAAEFKIRTGIDMDPDTIKDNFESIDWSDYINQTELTQAAADVAQGISAAFDNEKTSASISSSIKTGITDALSEVATGEDGSVKVTFEGIVKEGTIPPEEVKDETRTVTYNPANYTPPDIPDIERNVIYHPIVEDPDSGENGDNSNSGGGQQKSGGATTGATGTIGLAYSKGTLMGELGPELVVSKGRYFVVGQSGPEMVNLADDAIVFNHLQTKSLLEKGTSSTRGRAITNEQNAVAYATGSIHGGFAHSGSTRKAANDTAGGSPIWNLGFNAIKNLNKSDNDKPLKSFLKELERWYNWLQQIAHIEKEITYQEALRSKYQNSFNRTGVDYYNSQKESLKLLSAQLDVEKDLVQQRKNYLAQRQQELENSPFSTVYRFDERGQIQYQEGAFENFSKLFGTNDQGIPYYTAEQQYDALIAMGMEDYMKYDNSGQEIDKSKDGWQATAVQAFYDKMEKQREEFQSLHDDIMDGEEKIIELQDNQNQILHDIEDNQIAVEQKVLKAVEESRQRAIDDAKDERDAIEKSANTLIDGLNKQLEKERTMYQNQQSADELASLQRRLGILQRSGGSASEIADLQSQIEEKQYDKYFETQEQQIQAIQDASDAELERLDNQISLMEETLAYEKEFGLLWNEVDEVLKQSPEDIATYIKENTSEYWSVSLAELNQKIREDLFEIDQFKQFQNVDGGMQALINAYGGNTENTEESSEGQQNEDQPIEGGDGGSKYAENVAGTWKQGSDGRWWYEHNEADENGKKYTTNNWEKINDKWYYFDEEGWMKTGWLQDGDKWYYLDDTSGEMLTNTTKALTWNGKTQNHTFDENGVWTGATDIKTNTPTKKKDSDIPTADEIDNTVFLLPPMITEEQKKNAVHAASGGYASHGIYELGELGTETVLNASQTKVLRDNILSNRPDSLINLLKSYNEAYHGLSQNAYDSISNTIANMVNIERAEVNLQIEKLADDYDSRRAANTIMDEMLRIASKTKANNSVRR